MYKSVKALTSAYDEMKQAQEKLVEILAKENGYWERTEFVAGLGDEQGQNIQQKILKKGGAEIIAELLDLDIQLSEPSYKNVYKDEDMAGLHVVVTAKAVKDGKELAQGAGARSVSYDGYTLNTSIKMAQKSAFIDVVIRAARLSSIFMQEPPVKGEVAPENAQLQPPVTANPAAKANQSEAEISAVRAAKHELIAQIQVRTKELSSDFPPMFGKNSLEELTVEELEEIILMINSAQQVNNPDQQANVPVAVQKDEPEAPVFSDDFTAYEDDAEDFFEMP